MLNREVAINQFQLGVFSKIVSDLTEESLFTPGNGHGHPPAWILGHLAISAEMGQKLMGGEIQHPEWIPVFGAGSSGKVEPGNGLSLALLKQSLMDGYAKVQQMALDPTVEPILGRKHGVALFANSPIRTVEDAVAILLTNHFGFHMAQLSSCRRDAGYAALF
jgi:hypothetical protein